MADARTQPRAGFGTFGGVFTPCTLTILGVIMFLRFGDVVDAAGVGGALVIVLIAKVITTLTALSLSAIATNTRMRGGGAYFLISRSLGAEFGGSIGLVFYAAQAISVSMYVVGFTEAFLSSFPSIAVSPRIISSVVNLIVFVCVFIGAGWTIKLQYGILVVLLLSLGSFFFGAGAVADGARLSENFGSSYGAGGGFFQSFALFFPAATGIMAGANMSGDLREPGRAIPRGTLSSIAVTGVIYLAMAVFLGAASSRDALTGTFVVRDIAAIPWLITAGVFAATLSSALGSMMGAPRVLQALARDRIYRPLQPFARGSGAAGEPRRAVIVTFVVAEAAILFGELDAIAPIITMFFMMTYGYLNLATFYESRTRNPSYRPAFRFCHWSTSLLGALLCVGVMLLVSPLWAIVSILALGTLHRFTARLEIEATWGDARRGAAYERARRDLLVLEDEPAHAKNWRPAILVMSGAAGERSGLAVYGHWLTGGRGLLTLAQVIRGEVGAHLARREGQEAVLRRYIREEELPAFPVVLVSPSLSVGIEALVQCHGIGALRPNLVLLGWAAELEKRADFAGTLRTLGELDLSIALLRFESAPEDPWVPGPGTVDVWWRGRTNGHLMILLAHLLVQNEAWRGRVIRILRVIPNEAGVGEATAHLERLVTESRIRAESRVLVSDDPVGVIRSTSERAAFTIVGFEPPGVDVEGEFFERLGALTNGLPAVLSVCSRSEVSLEG